MRIRFDGILVQYGRVEDVSGELAAVRNSNANEMFNEVYRDRVGDGRFYRLLRHVRAVHSLYGASVSIHMAVHSGDEGPNSCRDSGDV